MAARDKTNLLNHLHSLVYFEALTPDQLEGLAAQTQTRHFAAAENIFLEGETAAGLWLVEVGRVKIYKINPDGEEHILHFLGAGNTFNDIAALDGGANPANAAALSDTTV